MQFYIIYWQKQKLLGALDPFLLFAASLQGHQNSAPRHGLLDPIHGWTPTAVASGSTAVAAVEAQFLEASRVPSLPNG